MKNAICTLTFDNNFVGSVGLCEKVAIHFLYFVYKEYLQRPCMPKNCSKYGRYTGILKYTSVKSRVECILLICEHIKETGVYSK